MADIVETVSAGKNTGGLNRVYSTRATGSGGLMASVRIKQTDGLRKRLFTFTSVGNADTWASGLTGIVCLATVALDGGATTQAATHNAAGLVTFNGSGAAPLGLIVWTAG